MKQHEQEQLFQRCSADMRSMFWRLTGAFVPESERQDLLQEIWVRLWLALPQFEGRPKLSTWAYRVALNTALKRARTNRRDPVTDPLGAHINHLRAPSSGEASQQLAAVFVALRTSKESDRALLLMALEELPRKEISVTLGITENAVHVRLHRARERVRQAIKEIPL